MNLAELLNYTKNVLEVLACLSVGPAILTLSSRKM